VGAAAAGAVMSPPPLLGLGLALAAAAGNNLGKGLQKAATRHLPQLNLGRSEVRSCACLCVLLVGEQCSVCRSNVPASSRQQLGQGAAESSHAPPATAQLGRSEVCFGVFFG
jgi:hypothetical protein